MFWIFPKVKETRIGKCQHFVKFTVIYIYIYIYIFSFLLIFLKFFSAIYFKYYMVVYYRGCYLAAQSNLAL